MGQGGEKRNPVYLFYEAVDADEDGEHGEDGNKYYKCYHGNRKILKVTKKMNGSLNGEFKVALCFSPTHLSLFQGLIGHLKDLLSGHVSALSRLERPWYPADRWWNSFCLGKEGFWCLYTCQLYEAVGGTSCWNQGSICETTSQSCSMFIIINCISPTLLTLE